MARITKEQVAHFLAGLLSALGVMVNPVLAIVGFLVFLCYEVDESWHIPDPAFQELREYGYGFYLGIVILMCLVLGNLV